MKKIFFAAAMLIASAQLFAQDLVIVSETSKIQDTVIIKSGQGKVVIERIEGGVRTEIAYYKQEKNRNYRKSRSLKYHMMMDFGWNNYDSRNIFTGTEGDEFLSLNTSKSINFAIYPWIGSIKLTNSKALNLVSGIGFDWNNYRFENGWTIQNLDGITIPSTKYRDGNQSLVEKSKLMTVYMNVPLMLQLNFPIEGSYRKNIFVSAGVIGGIKLGSHTKGKYNNGGGKDKERDSFNLNMFRYDLTFRAGYRGVGVYFNYQMNPMFESGNGPKLYPYAVGLTFLM